MIAHHPPSSSTHGPPAPSVPANIVSVCHYAVLGAVFPLMSVYLLRTPGFTWLQTGVALAMFPVGVLVAPAVRRLTVSIGLTSADGFAIAHLGAAGLSMGFVWWCDSATAPPGFMSFLPGFVLYAVLLTPTLTWHNEIMASANAGRPESIAWRLWAAVGFLLPAWLSEGILAGIDAWRPVVFNHQILPVMAGWLGVAAALAALVFRRNLGTSGESEARAEPQTVEVPAVRRETRPHGAAPKSGGRPHNQGLLLTVGVGVVIAVQRAHWLWTAPFFAIALDTSDAEPVVHRLIAISQVFETGVLATLGFCLSRFSVRKLLVVTAGLWIVRSVLFACVCQTTLTGSLQLACLFTGQILQGCAVAGFLGTLGAMVMPETTTRGARDVTRVIGVAGIIGCVTGGWLTGVLAGQSELLSPGDLPQQLSVGILPLNLGGWGGVWWIATLPALVAVPILCLARPAATPAGCVPPVPGTPSMTQPETERMGL